MGGRRLFRHRVHTGSRAHPASYSIGTGSCFYGVKSAGRYKLTTYLHLVPRLRMSGAISPLPTSSWRDVFVSTRIT
jgi:hypothetical protein